MIQSQADLFKEPSVREKLAEMNRNLKSIRQEFDRKMMQDIRQMETE